LMGLRYYDPSAGRFLTRDPSGYAGGANLYDYTENNPGNYTDPMGLNKIPLDYVLHGAGQALIGAGKGLIIVGGVVLLAPELGTAIAIGGVAYGGYKLGQGIYSMASGQEWSMDGNGPQMTDCEWASNLGSTVVGIGLLFGGAALADGAGGAGEAGEGGAPEGEAEPKPTGPGCDECLVGRSAIWMADGTTKPIDQVQVGDQVLSRDPDTGQDGVNTVTGTISRPADTLVTLALVDPSTHKTSTMTCTPGHPVYVEGKGWIEAGDLVAGNAIVTRTGSALTVASLQWQRDETGNHPFTVYNLTVEEDHTYFTGGLDGGLWVHNCAWSVKNFPDRDINYGSEKQHWIPQEFRGWVADQGVNINDYMSDIDGQYHDALHYGKGGGVYNDDWAGFIEDNPRASPQDILNFMQLMMDKYGAWDF